jgi:molybdopterin-containing oxidoreductase family iron-sulfur binding subunit
MDEHEHGEPDPQEVNRRTFLKLAGFTFATTLAGGCQRAPVRTALPMTTQAEEVVPGRSLFYASTCGGCTAGCGLLVKARDGRPIKLEGNPNHPLSQGGTCAVGQASILGLYDSQRLQGPLKAGAAIGWTEADAEISAQLQEIRRQGKAIRFLSSTITSPTTQRAITRFLADFPNSRHVVHDTLSCSAIREAHFRTHGVRVLPAYHLERARTIVSFDADFLGTWISPVQFTADYQAGRYLDGPAPDLSYHVQVESRLSLTGSKADVRRCVAPGEVGLLMTYLAALIAAKAGANWDAGELEPSPLPASFLEPLADRLWQSRGRALVLCGSQDVQQQLLCNLLNQLLEGYGATLSIAQPSYQNQSDDRALEELLEALRQDQVGALLVYRSNPVHDLPGGAALAESLRRVPLLVSFAARRDETAELARFVCPEPHYLEAWDDAEAVDGVVSLYQPVLQPLGETRPLMETLAAWRGQPQSAQEQLRASWQTHVYPRRLIEGAFAEFWQQAVHDGLVRVRPQPDAVRPFARTAVVPVRQAVRSPETTYSLVLYRKIGMPDSGQAYNPWLHELPDPISKITWDNYACLAPALAARLGVRQGDVVRLQADEGPAVELPAVVQPGQHERVVAVALGYGSRLSERFATIGPPWLEARPGVAADGRVGVNAAPLLLWRDGALHDVRAGVRLEKTPRRQELACTQEHTALRVPLALATAGQPARPPIQETTLAALQRQVTRPALAESEPRRDLWPAAEAATGPRWGMAIDLQACTGCSACVIACQVENNIPVVGKDEVHRHREMHWIRLDRYYAPATDEGNVQVAHQPMLCQHCGNAPCEVVCPVLATVHSAEGLNQQVYNRCVGTRYCANNCPYKVRRFNWFDYAHDDQLQNLVLNPDVTVRSRGVMEKCTFCVQRIQEARIEARRLGRALADGDVQTACQQACPAHVITFGDLNDPRSRAAQLTGSRRAYRVFEELNVRPSVSYLNVVRQPSPATESR